jgi:hypothetical protein
MPSSQYIVRGKINGGMEVNRANAVWRVYCQPKATTQEDVATIFFDEELPHNWRYNIDKARPRMLTSHALCICRMPDHVTCRCMRHARTPGQVHGHLG